MLLKCKACNLQAGLEWKGKPNKINSMMCIARMKVHITSYLYCPRNAGLCIYCIHIQCDYCGCDYPKPILDLIAETHMSILVLELKLDLIIIIKLSDIIKVIPPGLSIPPLYLDRCDCPIGRPITSKLVYSRQGKGPKSTKAYGCS